MLSSLFFLLPSALLALRQLFCVSWWASSILWRVYWTKKERGHLPFPPPWLSQHIHIFGVAFGLPLQPGAKKRSHLLCRIGSKMCILAENGSARNARVTPKESCWGEVVNRSLSLILCDWSQLQGRNCDCLSRGWQSRELAAILVPFLVCLAWKWKD